MAQGSEEALGMIGKLQSFFENHGKDKAETTVFLGVLQLMDTSVSTLAANSLKQGKIKDFFKM